MQQVNDQRKDRKDQNDQKKRTRKPKAHSDMDIPIRVDTAIELALGQQPTPSSRGKQKKKNVPNPPKSLKTPVPGDGAYLMQTLSANLPSFTQSHSRDSKDSRDPRESHRESRGPPPPGHGAYLMSDEATPGTGAYLLAQANSKPKLTKPISHSLGAPATKSHTFSTAPSPQLMSHSRNPADFYAGGAFHNSPAASALPIPSTKPREGLAASHESKSGDETDRSWKRDLSPQLSKPSPLQHAKTFDVFTMDELITPPLPNMLPLPKQLSSKESRLPDSAKLSVSKAESNAVRDKRTESSEDVHPLLGLLASASKKPSSPAIPSASTSPVDPTMALKNLLRIS